MFLCGKNVFKEYVNNHTEIKEVYLLKDFKDQEILNIIATNKMFVKFLERSLLDKMTRENHQGLVFTVADFKYNTLKDISNNDFLVMLDHIEDPHNFGAIIRTCEGAGVAGIIIPKDRAVEVNGTVIRTSTGAIANTKIVQVTNLVNTIKELKKAGFWFYGADMAGDDYNATELTGKVCLVIGNEGKGLSRLVKEECDFVVSIPMYGKVNSLNASVAAGVIIFKAVNDRGAHEL